MFDLGANLRKYFLPVIFVLVAAISFLKPSTGSLQQVAGRIQNKLNGIETIFELAAADSSLKQELVEGNESSAPVEKIKAKGIYLYYYDKDSLIHWTSNNVLPLGPPSSLPVNTSLIKLKNGWYQVMKSRDSPSHALLVGLFPVKYEYPYENKFLKNDFALGLKTPHNIEISEQKIHGSIPVKNLKGDTMFSLYAAGDEKGEDINFLLVAAQLVLLGLVFYFINRVFSLVKRKGFLSGFIVLVAGMATLRILMFYFDQYGEFYKLDLFNPKYYASSVFTKSLGDLIINAFLLAWGILFADHYKTAWKDSIRKSALASWALLALVFPLTGISTWVFKTLVLDSVISFEVYNILSLNYYSLLGMLCLAFLLIVHFTFARNAVLILAERKSSQLQVFIFSGVCTTAYMLFAFQSSFDEIIVFSGLWTVFFLVIINTIMRFDATLNIRNLILFISLYSIFSTYLIEDLYERKERNQRKFFASRLVSERDFVAEYMFNDVAQRIENDPFIKQYFINPAVPKRDITARLSSLYLSGYFNKYDLKVHTYDREGESFKNRDSVPVSVFYDLLGTDSVTYQKLSYVKDTAQNYSYISFMQFKEDSGRLGELVLQLIPKVYYGQNVYPELLLGENITSDEENNVYDYAIYRHDKLIIQHGDFPYTYYWSKDFKFDEEQFIYIDIGDWEHILYRFPNDMKVVVYHRSGGLV